jgi:hypothetical protein
VCSKITRRGQRIVVLERRYGRPALALALTDSFTEDAADLPLVTFRDCDAFELLFECGARPPCHLLWFFSRRAPLCHLLWFFSSWRWEAGNDTA